MFANAKKLMAAGGFVQLILVGLLMVSAFFIGSLYTKVKVLEKSGGTGSAVGANVQAPAPSSKYPSFEEAMKALAREVKLDDKKLVECMNRGDKKTIIDADVAQGNKFGVGGTPTFFINGRLISGALPFAEFKKVIDEELGGKVDAAASRSSVVLGNAPTQGKSGAPITLIEFSDFQCPFCERAFPTIREIMKQYEGKVLFAYKHYPLTAIHARAQKTAEAAECARDQGKFWEFHDKLFAAQNDWSSL